jgi:GNAT superfamily N-acetyltransferase
MASVERLQQYSLSDATAIGQLLLVLNPKFPGTPVDEDLLRDIISSPHHDQIVARIDDEIVGIATLSVTIGTGAGRKAYLEDFVVSDKVQGQGIGSLIWKEIANWCEERQLVLHFTSNPSRQLAHKFYLKHGATIRETSVFEFKGE